MPGERTKFIRKARLLAALAASALASAPPVAARADLAEEVPDDPAYASIRLFANAIQLIRQDYVDETKTSYEQLVHSALRGMLSELDPHSQFLDREAFRSMQEDTKSEFGGLGIQVGLRGGALVIVSPMEGTPAFEAGLLPGDRILKINGRTTDRLSLPDAVDLLRGEVGEKVTLTIQRPSDREIREFTLQRAVIKVKSVRDVRFLPAESTGGRKIAYLRVSQFSEPTAKELDDALTRLQAEGAEALVMDLRYNPGGLLSSAIDVAAQFLPPDTEVVSTAGRAGGRPYFTSKQASRNRGLPLAILINSASASGAEIVAGALKDLGRALLVGETTFGKGSVQGVSEMGDGTAIRLTTATYLTPARQVIHERGVRPHILSVLTPAQEIALLRSRQQAERHADLPGEEAGPGELAREAPRQEADDPQLQRAAEVLQGVLIHRER